MKETMIFLGSPLKKTIYPHSGVKVQFLLTTPHDSLEYKSFWQQFPKIFECPELAKQEKLFSTYLAIEQDRGARDLAEQLAFDLSKELPQGQGVMLIEFNAPRGIVDCGRLKSHCIRGFLPKSLIKIYQQEFFLWQQKAHEDLFIELEALKKNNGLVLDIHTMASYGPESSSRINYQEDLPKETWSDLEKYVDIYSRKATNLRSIDLITCDEKEVFIADKKLASKISFELKNSYLVSENTPYEARSYFLMNLLMKKARGLALDIPKHLLASEDLDKDFSLASFTVSDKKLKKISACLTAGILAAIS